MQCCGTVHQTRLVPVLEYHGENAAFIASWVVTFIIISTAQTAGGDIDKLIRATDMYGRICGIDDGVVDLPYGAWPWPEYYSILVCVDNCSATSEVMHPEMVVPYESELYYSFCIPDIAAYLGMSSSSLTASETSGLNVTSDMIGSTTSFMSFGDPYGSWAATFSNGIGDIYASSGAIQITGFCSILIAFLVIFLIGKFITCLVYVLLAAVVLASLVLGSSLATYADECINGDDAITGCTISDEEAGHVQSFAYFWFAFGVLFFLVMFYLRDKIKIAIEVIKESAHAVFDMPMIMLFPFVPVILCIFYMMYWIWGSAILYSVTVDSTLDTPMEVKYWFAYESDIFRNENPDTYIQKDFDSSMQYPFLFHFFHMLWVLQFLLYFCYLVFAGATADWYFTRLDENGKRKRGNGKDELPRFPLHAAFVRTMLHHLGTIAVCSLIIAIIQFIRACVHYIESKTKGDPPSQAQEVLFKLIHCCLACVECCADKINKNALIWTAIFGDGFATSACSSFKLILDNIGRVAAISVVSHLIIWVGKVFCAIITAFLGMLLVSYMEPYASEVSSPWFPTFLMFVMGYGIGSMFMSVFNAVIDCVFLCFLVDDKFNKAEASSKSTKMFASDNLLRLVNKYQGESKKHARAEKRKRKHRAQMRAGNKVEPDE